MRYLWAFFRILTVVISLSAQSLYANAQTMFDQKPLIEELFQNMPFYVEYLENTPAFTATLDDGEKERLRGLANYFRNIQRMPDLDFSRPRSEFFLEPEPGQPEEGEKTAKTWVDEYSSVDFNMEKIAVESIRFDIPSSIQILIHEFGHKLPNSKERQAVLDGLATKASVYFKSYTKEMKISERRSIHSLSLPINWFYWPLTASQAYYHPSYRVRPNTTAFLRSAEKGFESLTKTIYDGLASPVLHAARDTQNQAFTDYQTHIDGWETTFNGFINAIARNQVRLQDRKGPRNPYVSEAYGKVVDSGHHLQTRFYDDNKKMTFRSVAKERQNLANSVRTVLKKESETSYSLTLPEYKSEAPVYLRLSTAQGTIVIAAEKNAPGSFRFTVPKKGPGQFVEIQAIQDAENGIQFLDQAYWFAVNKGPAREAKVQSMQVEVNKKYYQFEQSGWEDLLPGSGRSVTTRWGKAGFKIELEKQNKIRQIRLVWAIERKHFESHNIKRPFINNLFESPSIIYAKGYPGAEYAHEFDIIEETFAEDSIQQDKNALTVQADLWAKHIYTESFATYATSMGAFMGHYTRSVTTRNVLGEDMGYWKLLDVFVTDENLESTSLLAKKEPIHIGFTGSGFTECEEFLFRRQFEDRSLLENAKGRRKPWKMD